MAGVASDDLEWMREAQEEFLPDQVTIERRTDVSNGRGGRTTTWSAVGTFPARIAAPTGEEGVVAAQQDANRGFILTLPHDAGLRTTDRVRRGSDVFEVVHVMAPQSWHTATRANVRIAA